MRKPVDDISSAHGCKNYLQRLLEELMDSKTAEKAMEDMICLLGDNLDGALGLLGPLIMLTRTNSSKRKEKAAMCAEVFFIQLHMLANKLKGERIWLTTTTQRTTRGA